MMDKALVPIIFHCSRTRTLPLWSIIQTGSTTLFYAATARHVSVTTCGSTPEDLMVFCHLGFHLLPPANRLNINTEQPPQHHPYPFPQWSQPRPTRRWKCGTRTRASACPRYGRTRTTWRPWPTPRTRSWWRPPASTDRSSSGTWTR